MRLKLIKIAGFKSFVDPTTVHFPSNMCAVVGPNGCGKSNIIDAVRWVMGESSAKNLRGESMTDVIFNGSTGRKPIGQASVELIFDNSDGTVQGEYAAFSEISIRRKVTREAKTFYYLNGSKCRRRDITDIFLGTGLGPRSYSIISQGVISNLVESKPEDLRVYIEEAAGISKYKERRRDTENRIRRTKENLERLSDLREELGRQLHHLQRQAQAAEKYSEFKAEERLKKAQLQALRWKSVDLQVREREASIRDLAVNVEACMADQRKLDSLIETQREEQVQSSEQLNLVQGRFYSVGGEIARIEQSISHSAERSKQLHEDLRKASENLQQTQEHLDSDRVNLEALEEELDLIEPELELVQEAEEESRLLLENLEEQLQSWQLNWDEFNHSASQPQRHVEIEQARIQQLQQQLGRSREQIKRLSEESQQQDSGELEESAEILEEQLSEQELLIEEQQEQHEEVLLSVADTRKQIESCEQQLNEKRSAQQVLLGRTASLQALQQGAEEGSIAPWLADNDLENLPRLVQSLEVEAGWEQALETVLGDYLQALCVNSLDELSAKLPSLNQGTLTALSLASASIGQADSSADSLIGSSICNSLASKLKAGPDLSAFLTGVYCADDVPQALALRAQLKSGESVITQDGVWFSATSLRVSRDDDPQQGVLLRQQELQDCEQQLAILIDSLDQDVMRLEEQRERLSASEAQREQLQQQRTQLQAQQADLRSQLNTCRMQVQQRQQRHAQIQLELSQLVQQQSMDEEGLEEASAALEEARQAMSGAELEREQRLSERDQIRSGLDDARQRARHDKDKAHQLALREQSLRTQQTSMMQAMQRLQQQAQVLSEQHSRVADNLAQSLAPDDEYHLLLEELLEQRLQVEEELSAARIKVEGLDFSLREHERERLQAEQAGQKEREALEAQRMQWQSLQVQRSTFEAQLEEAQFDLQVVLETLPLEADVSVWEEDIRRIEQRIQRLGAINLAAIDEYKSQSERKVYLDAQNDDLDDALNTLEGAIRRIDKETRARFKETFDKVNTGLQALFPRVFGGGSAYLDLTGEDLLDTGVTIMARPPGKKNSTIHLLSGGEKALTAIALVFSIFQLNPSPFCMLDEVDAPLDDANVERYARMVEEMSASVQFIFITHNKVAMEAANQLLGVTMHEPGVSRMVSVDIDEAAALAAV